MVEYGAGAGAGDDKGLADRVRELTLENERLRAQAQAQGANRLIRSHTFTRSPPDTRSPDGEGDEEASLEEISLRVMKSVLAEKSELVRQYSRMITLQADEPASRCEPSPSPLDEDIRRRILKLERLRGEALRQRADLETILAEAEKRRNECSRCPTCEGTNGERRERESSETEAAESSTKWGTPVDSTSYREIPAEVLPSALPEEDRDAAESARRPGTGTCPICGEDFGAAEFRTFIRHVEEHFVGESDFESIDCNSEIATNVADRK